MAFSQAVSGLNAAATNLDVIGNNIANSATYGFKSGTASFADMFAGSKVGLGVKVAGITQDFTDGTSTTTTTPFGVELQQPADKVTATIKDASGNVVRTIEIGELKAGVHTFTWDGSLTDGTKEPNGSYQVAISASNGTTQLVAQPLQFALVQGVIKGSDGNKLDLGTSGTTTLDEVRQII